MTNDTEKTSAKAGGITGFLGTAYEASMIASRNVAETMMTLPIVIAEGVGAPEDKTKMARDFSRGFLDGLYGGTDKAVRGVAGAVTAPFRWVTDGIGKLTASAGTPAVKTAETAATKEAVAESAPAVARKPVRARKLPAKAKRPVITEKDIEAEEAAQELAA